MLALLKQEERYGFDLVRALGKNDGIVIGEGTIYPLLGASGGRAWSRRRGANPCPDRHAATTT